MNFGERFKSHAKTLAEAAKQFQSFDDMAAQDDYIHSDSLNVKATTTTAVSESPTQRTSELLDSLISPISMNPHQDHAEPHQRSSNASFDHASDHASHYDEEEGGSHDPILDTIRYKTPLKKKSSDVMPEERKAASRFMDDLNDRLSKPNVDVEQGLPKTTTAASESPTNLIIETNNRWGWMKGAATSKMKDFMGKSEETIPFRSPLSRTTSSVVSETPKEEEFHVVQSSAILGEEDQAELDRIRLGAQGDTLTFILNIVKQHPQFAFIAFTLVLASAMYFYSRHEGAEDDVN